MRGSNTLRKSTKQSLGGTPIWGISTRLRRGSNRRHVKGLHHRQPDPRRRRRRRRNVRGAQRQHLPPHLRVRCNTRNNPNAKWSTGRAQCRVTSTLTGRFPIEVILNTKGTINRRKHRRQVSHTRRHRRRPVTRRLVRLTRNGNKGLRTKGPNKGITGTKWIHLSGRRRE